MLLRPLGSTPLVGSSRITALESPTKARATQRRRCIPPEREDTTASCTCHRSTSCNSLKQSHVATLHTDNAINCFKDFCLEKTPLR